MTMHKNRFIWIPLAMAAFGIRALVAAEPVVCPLWHQLTPGACGCRFKSLFQLDYGRAIPNLKRPILFMADLDAGFEMAEGRFFRQSGRNTSYASTLFACLAKVDPGNRDAVRELRTLAHPEVGLNSQGDSDYVTPR
jgi:hypothetical protein